MKAMILAAGLGTRLKPLTEKIPKALIEVGSVPMLGRCIEFLKQACVDLIVVNMHHFPDQVANYLEDLMEYHDIGVEIRWVYEPELLETAGAVANVREFLLDSEPVILMNCDILTNLNLGALVGIHHLLHSFATLAVKTRHTDRPFLVDLRGRVVGHRNKKIGVERRYDSGSGELREYGFCGVEVVSQEFLNFLVHQKTKGVSLTEIHLAAVQAGENIRIFNIGEASWFDIGTQEKLAEAEAWIQRL